MFTEMWYRSLQNLAARRCSAGRGQCSHWATLEFSAQQARLSLPADEGLVIQIAAEWFFLDEERQKPPVGHKGLAERLNTHGSFSILESHLDADGRLNILSIATKVFTYFLGSGWGPGIPLEFFFLLQVLHTAWSASNPEVRSLFFSQRICTQIL